MSGTILITGGAGFVGSHVCDELLRAGWRVRLLDNLSPQVHPEGPPSYLAPEAELVVGDIRDRSVVERCVDGADAVIHLAALVGVGQSMYRIHDYVDTNDAGTAVLLQVLAGRPLKKLVVASSMSIYGEGRYITGSGAIVDDATRLREQLQNGQWDVVSANGRPLRPVPTPENKTPSLSSLYALTKYAQERMSLIIGAAYGISTVALRFFNIYGPRQALSNPYTGVLAIFAARLLNGNRPLIYEDGLQLRDFVHVRDIARACRLAVESGPGVEGVYNIGGGRGVPIAEVARRLADVLGRSDLEPELAGRSRTGDIRHCFADISRAQQDLSYEPQVDFDAGLVELAEWLGDQVATDRVDEATDELMRRGLVA